MLVEQLSDHPGDQLRRADAAELRRMEVHRSAVSSLQAQHAASRRWWQFGTRLKQRGELRALRAAAPRPDPQAAIDRARLAAGVGGEQAMSAALAVLPDDWRLFRGYVNRRGEVDHLLVGPGGVWAIEVKYRRVRVHVDGDVWRYEKVRYGNVVEQGVLADRGGRSWSRQVGEIAGELERFLASRGRPVAVRTAVVVMHPRAELGSLRDLRVGIISIGPAFLLQSLHAEPQPLDSAFCDAVAGLIRRDHAFHAARRAKRGAR